MLVLRYIQKVIYRALFTYIELYIYTGIHYCFVPFILALLVSSTHHAFSIREPTTVLVLCAHALNAAALFTKTPWSLSRVCTGVGL